MIGTSAGGVELINNHLKFDPVLIRWAFETVLDEYFELIFIADNILSVKLIDEADIVEGAFLLFAQLVINDLEEVDFEGLVGEGGGEKSRESALELWGVPDLVFYQDRHIFCF